MTGKKQKSQRKKQKSKKTEKNKRIKKKKKRRTLKATKNSKKTSVIFKISLALQKGVIMKKLICLILTVSMLFLFASCNGSENEGNSQAEKKTYTASADEAGYPNPIEQNWEESNNATGARFDMTLEEFTEKFNKMYNSLGGGSQQLELSNWQKQSSDQHDENGVAYDYYYYADDKAVLTATVEQESGKIMNLGCGTTVSVFINEENTQYQSVI